LPVNFPLDKIQDHSIGSSTLEGGVKSGVVGEFLTPDYPDCAEAGLFSGAGGSSNMIGIWAPESEQGIMAFYSGLLQVVLQLSELIPRNSRMQKVFTPDAQFNTRRNNFRESDFLGSNHR
jgi:hypothetical protein